jgi:hypothetical protein
MIGTPNHHIIEHKKKPWHMLIEINVLVQKYESDWVKRIMGSQPPSADSWNSNSNTEINRPYSFDYYKYMLYIVSWKSNVYYIVNNQQQQHKLITSKSWEFLPCLNFKGDLCLIFCLNIKYCFKLIYLK